MARIVVVTKEERDYSRTVSDWLEDFYRATGRQIEIIDPDQNAAFCEAYDVVEYPTVLALDEGGVLFSWKGLPLPTRDEVLYYMI